MSAEFDPITIGAGHNGVVAAGYLAAAGKKVLAFRGAVSCRGRAGGRSVCHERLLSPGLDDLLSGFDDLRRGRLTNKPFVGSSSPSRVDP